jgi:hypothetical protein
MATNRHFEEDEDIILPANKKAVMKEEEDEPKAKQKARFDEEEEEDKPVTTKKKPRFDDEEDEPKAKKGKNGEKDEEDLPLGVDVDFGDEKVMKRPGRLERLEMDGAKAKRFAFIPGFKVKAANTHYIKDQGTFVCNSSEEEETVCCELFGESDFRALAIVVEYTNAKSKDGSMPKDEDIEWEIKYLRMSRKNFSDISKLKMEDETIYDFDLVMRENDNNIGYNFAKISKKAWWRVDEEVEAQVLKAASKFADGKALQYHLGRKASAIEYKLMAKKAKPQDEDEL